MDIAVKLVQVVGAGVGGFDADVVVFVGVRIDMGKCGGVGTAGSDGGCGGNVQTRSETSERISRKVLSFF